MPEPVVNTDADGQLSNLTHAAVTPMTPHVLDTLARAEMDRCRPYFIHDELVMNTTQAQATEIVRSFQDILPAWRETVSYAEAVNRAMASRVAPDRVWVDMVCSPEQAAAVERSAAGLRTYLATTPPPRLPVSKFPKSIHSKPLPLP